MAKDLPGTSVGIIFYDGYCGFCTWWVRFIIARDPEMKFRFAPLQSAYASEVLQWNSIDPKSVDTVVLVTETGIYTKSTAALTIASHLEGPMSVLSGLLYLPRWIRDLGYDIIASQRYRFFGRKDTCNRPTDTPQDRFIGLDENPNDPSQA